MPSRPASWPLSALGAERWATVIRGTSRPLVNRVLFAVVRSIDPQPYWLEIPGRTAEPDEPGPAELGWIPPSRLVYPRGGGETRPQPVAGSAALVAPDPAGDTWEEGLPDLLRLPPVLQEIVGRIRAGDKAQAIAIANADRIGDQYPDRPEEMGWVRHAFAAMPLQPIFSSLRAAERQAAADVLLEVRADGMDRWQTGTLTCVKAPPGAPFAPGLSARLAAFPEIVRAVEGDRSAG